MPTRTTVLSPEQEQSLASTILRTNLPSTPTGEILAAKGYDKEANRLERCGKIRYRKCRNHHVDRRLRMRCGLGFCCAGCATEQASKRFEEWKPMLASLSEHRSDCSEPGCRVPKQFTYVDFSPPTGRDREEAAQWLGRLKKFLLGKDPASAPPYWVFFAGYTPQGAAIIRLLLLDNQAIEWEKHFPYSSPQVHVVPMYRILYFFRELLNVPYWPKDPRDRAEHQILFKGVHQLRHHGVSPSGFTACVGEHFSVEEETPTEKSGEDKSSKHKCLECGCLLEYASSDYMSEFAALQSIEWERNTDLPDPSPPSK